MQHDLSLQGAAPPAPTVTITAQPMAGGQHQISVTTNISGPKAQVWESVTQMLLAALRSAIAEGQQAGESRIVVPQAAVSLR